MFEKQNSAGSLEAAREALRHQMEADSLLWERSKENRAATRWITNVTGRCKKMPMMKSQYFPFPPACQRRPSCNWMSILGNIPADINVEGDFKEVTLHLNCMSAADSKQRGIISCLQNYSDTVFPPAKTNNSSSSEGVLASKYVNKLALQGPDWSRQITLHTTNTFLFILSWILYKNKSVLCMDIYMK